MSIGVIRGLDKLGRVTLPAEFRKYLGIDTTDKVEIVLKEDGIKIKPIKKEK